MDRGGRGFGAPDTYFDLLVVIDNRALERECFLECLDRQNGPTVVGYASIGEWKRERPQAGSRQVILNNIGSNSLSDEKVRAGVREVVAEAESVPVVVLGTTEDIEAAIMAMDCGAVGYIPTCVRFSDIASAAHLALAGGTFLPKSSLLALRRVPVECGNEILQSFTERQLAVAQVLRRGAANKTIAYELDLQESTVKVHIRHIFQKLKATNRTQAAFLLNKMTGWPDSSSTKEH